MWDVQGSATALQPMRMPMHQQFNAGMTRGMGMAPRAQFQGMGGTAPLHMPGPQGPAGQSSVAGQFANPNSVQMARMNMPERPPVDMSDPRNAALAGYR